MLNWNFAEGFHPTSKVWIYQSSRELNAAEVNEIENSLKLFSKEWTAHKQELKATGTVLLNRFVVLLVDESLNLASGCSIDSSVKFIRSLEIQYQISLLDRSVLLFEENGNQKEVLLSQLNEKISNNEILPATFYFNNSVTTLAEMKTYWKIPVKDSWMASRFKSAAFKPY